jgi:hypothetical protein
MDKVSRLSTSDRRDLFNEAASKRALAPIIIEKDFWVCQVLKILFQSPLKESLVFKGGTSLSKVYGLIDRFSEDIDLVLDWKLFGYGEGAKDPMRNFDSNTRQDKFNKEINRSAAEYIQKTLQPQIDSLVREPAIGLTASLDPNDPHTINVHYPAAFKEVYIRPEVRLEIGPLASWIPSSAHVIRPYAFDVLPEIFTNPDCAVVAIAAERTFWEKATILHQEGYRPGQIPQRYSRHYYDLCKLAASNLRKEALARVDLLKDVVEFKRRFYPSKWARYDLAFPGSFKLLPSSDENLKYLENDYHDMRVMVFGEIPPFEHILRFLADLEAEINAL